MAKLFSTDRFTTLPIANNSGFLIEDCIKDKVFLRLRNENELDLVRKLILELDKRGEPIEKDFLLHQLKQYRHNTNEDRYFVNKILIKQKEKKIIKKHNLDLHLLQPYIGKFTNQTNNKPKKIIESEFFAGYDLEDVFREMKKVEDYLY